MGTSGTREATLSSAVFATAPGSVPPPVVPGVLRRAAGVVGEVFLLVGAVFCFPLAVLAIGVPIALFVRLLLWLGGLL